MAASCGIPYDVLAWTAEWYIREETLREANICLVNYHHRLPMTTMFGSGTLSSSDWQRFPTRGKSITARHLNKYFVSEGISTYTHVSDQHSTFGTKVIVATHREAHYVLDEILGNATDLPISEHATDTHGVTLVNFGLFDLVGKQLSPRIRDLGKITLYRMGAKADYEERFPTAGPLLTKKANLDLVADHWDDLLRLAGSLKYGHATASLIVGKLSASSRQNALAAALKEYGAIRRTIYAAKYLSDESYRRKIARQLNKGESLHALRRQLHYAREGKVARRQPEQQNEQAWCLTVVTNSVVCWHTEYMGLAVDELRTMRPRGGRRGAGTRLPGPQLGGQLLRLHHRRLRARTRPARRPGPPAAADCGHGRPRSRAVEQQSAPACSYSASQPAGPSPMASMFSMRLAARGVPPSARALARNCADRRATSVSVTSSFRAALSVLAVASGVSMRRATPSSTSWSAFTNCSAPCGTAIIGTPARSPSPQPPIPAWVTKASACSRIALCGTQECTSTLGGMSPISCGLVYLPIWSTMCQPGRFPYAATHWR